MLWLFFGLRGRISRQVYWLAYLAILCVQAVLIRPLVSGIEASMTGAAPAVWPLFLLLATLYCHVAISVKRLHDVAYSGFLAFAVLVPLVQLVFTVWVGIMPGTAGPNPYGDAEDSPT